jgi:hypothetical protein
MGRYNRVLLLVISLASLFFLVAVKGFAQSKKSKEYKFKGTRIEGTREKPKDLYILPWQGTSLLEDTNLEIHFFSKEDRTKDRHDMRKERDYYQKIGKTEKSN